MAVRAFISYSHDSAGHLDRVWDLCEGLRHDGIDCRIDQHEFSPPEGWPHWCHNQVQESQFVLVVCTETYKRRYEGKAPAGEGKGAKWDGFIITLGLYEAEGRNTKFIPVVFSPKDAQHIPPELRGATRYDLSIPDAYDNLIGHVTNQPRRRKSDVAPQIRPMPPVARRQQFRGPLWNVPLPRNPFFTGRKEKLEELGRALSSDRVAALTGLGGVGKTQIAAHFAHEHGDEYSAVLWASAASPQTLISDLAAIAGLLNLPEKDEKEQGLAVAAVKRWLEGNGGWLLILDNASDWATVHGFIPQAAKGDVLLTTQVQATAPIRAIEVRDLPPKDGALLFLRRAKIIKAGAPLAVAAGPARDTAMHISTELGGLPLALEQAGAYIEETHYGLARYLDLYRRCRAELLKRRGGFGPEHPESVATTFALSFERVASASRAAADLLRLCAFLHPDAIPEEIFTEGAAELGPNLSAVTADPPKLNAALAEILKYSLLRRDADAKMLEIHRLVREVIQNGLTKEGRRQWAKRAVRAVNQAFPLVEFGNWTQCERLVPQALACGSLVDTYVVEFKEAARLLNQAGLYLSERARFSDAEPLYQRALAIKEKVLGPEHPSVATTLNNLAALYDKQGKYAQAEPLCQRASAIFEKVLGPEHPDVATSLDNLAALYDNQGKYAQAEPLFERALALREKALGPDHPDLATGLNNLASVYSEQGKYAQAEPLFERALALREKALRPDHPDLATSLHNLAALYNKQGKHALAEPLFERALALREKALAHDHPDVTESLNNLAALYNKQGKCAQAEPLLERALALEEKALGPEHPSVATTLNSLAELHRAQGRHAQAEPLYQRALAIGEKVFGPEHPEVATSLNNLASLHDDQGKYAQAEPLYRRALAIDRKVLGPNHPGVARDLNKLALLYAKQGKYAQAEPLYQRALAITKKALGPDHPDVAAGLNDLAALYYDQGKYAQAQPLYQRALAIDEKALGPNHPGVATDLNNLAVLCKNQGLYAQAEPLYQRALAVDEKSLGPDHPGVARDLNNLALLYSEQGQYAQAEPLYQRALAINEKAFGPEHTNVATVLENYAPLLREMKRGRAARELEARAQAIRAAHAKTILPSKPVGHPVRARRHRAAPESQKL